MRRKIVLLSLAALLVVGLFAYFRYKNSFGSVEVNIDQQVSASIYVAVAENEHQAEEESDTKPVATFIGSFKGKLKKGFYVLVTEGGGDYIGESINFEVSSEPAVLNVSPAYSDEKLKSLLEEERPAITEALKAKYPTLPEGYKIVDGQLFGRGVWYGGLLKHSNSKKYDTLRYIAGKQSGQWTILTNPPDIVLSSVIYPDLDKEILRAVNNLKP